MITQHQFIPQLETILDASLFQLSNESPSQWAENHRVIPKGVSARPGSFSWKNSPTMREPVDFFSPYNAAHTMAVMKAAQFSFSTSVLENAIGYRIQQHPCNILYLVGHDDQLESTMNKLDLMFDASDLRRLIRSAVKRARNTKSGDTDRVKQFPNGLIKLNTTNFKSLRGESYTIVIVDDFEAMKGKTKQAGAIRTIIEQRAAAFKQHRKICYASSPELKKGSNIEAAYLLGDQRRYHINCPHCNGLISLDWSVELSPEARQLSHVIENNITKSGISYRLNDNKQLITDSVGYICPLCVQWFDDRYKDKIVAAGHWVPTATPSQPGYLSYQISALYAPGYMYDWAHYVNNYIIACPEGGPIDDALLQAHNNLCLGITHEPISEAPKANQLQKNIRNYEIGTVPHRLSIKDGNGPIILLTCAVDMNGTVEDGRLDYEVVGWSKAGASYSIDQGSIGTFVPKENQKAIKEDRPRFTYEHNRHNSVWPILDKVLDKIYLPDLPETDPDYKRMKISITALDTGHFTTDYAYPYVDSRHHLFNVVGVKGKETEKYTLINKDQPSFTPALERNNLYLINVNQVKDRLANYMQLFWDDGNDTTQPRNFMNYPTPSAGKYLYATFFTHYEAEVRLAREDKDGNATYMIWQKKDQNHQNHFWDVRVYNLAARDILVNQITHAHKIPKGTWADFVGLMIAAKAIK